MADGSAMDPFRAVDAVVLDVLGTMVDEASGIRRALRRHLPGADEDEIGRLTARWQEVAGTAQTAVVDGRRGFARAAALDHEAAATVLAEGDAAVDRATVAGLVRAARLPDPWPDSADLLDRIARDRLVIGLSNAGLGQLARLSAHAGLRWHLALSAEAAGTFKPDPAAYRLAVDAAGVAPERVLMVAAHAWDLRGAARAGMRTAYVPRPVADPPLSTDRFDLVVGSAAELADALAP
ncbi:haloacid dehalogenase type II [Nocardioides sambongensis]|uniref:haloacid dehalogenase type II n=1 Tax=Nocardioides sambongensis TaxID=2589074 RepID=UPI001E5A5A31|nr:haloacid dehalogenase type II [Nocardioides sambongensis]